MQAQPDAQNLYRARVERTVAFIVPEGTTSDPVIGVMDIPAGYCLVGRCTCEAAQIQSAYRTLYGQWLPGSGYQPENRPCYELYHTTPETHPQGQYVLDVCLPVVPLSAR